MKCPNWPTRVLVAALILESGAACNKRPEPTNSPAPDTSSPPEAPDDRDWPVYEVRSHKFALSLPPEWRQIDMSPEGFESGLRETLKHNPEFAAALRTLPQQAANGIRLFGFDPASVRSINSTNINVLHVTLPAETTLDKFAADSLKTLEGTPSVSKPIAHERVKLTQGDCERVSYRMSLRNPSGNETTLVMIQYTEVRGKDLFIMTMATVPGQEPKYAGIFERIGQSSRITY
jgi:hypothetical protein